MPILSARTRYHLLELLPKEWTTAIEVGVRYGIYAKEMLNRTNMHIHCVDPWEYNAELHDPHIAFARFMERVYKTIDRVTIVKDYSYNAHSMFIDNSIDFVYIDALHDYTSVKRDITLFYPKVKSGGIFAGHDYGSDWPGIIQAVDEFCAENNYELHLTTDEPVMEIDEGQKTWYIIKR